MHTTFICRNMLFLRSVSRRECLYLITAMVPIWDCYSNITLPLRPAETSPRKTDFFSIHWTSLEFQSDAELSSIQISAIYIHIFTYTILANSHVFFIEDIQWFLVKSLNFSCCCTISNLLRVCISAKHTPIIQQNCMLLCFINVWINFYILLYSERKKGAPVPTRFIL